MTLSSSLSLSNTMLVPTFSNKLLSVGQAIEELNSCALIYPKFACLRIFSLRRLLVVVLNKEGCTTWMNLMLVG